jgi:hypothetical protein
LHKILDCILESFKAAQQPGALSNSTIRLGRIAKVVNLYVPLQFIIGDVEGGDQLSSRYSYRQIQCPRICRTCDVSTLDCTRTDITCTRIKVADIQRLYNTQNKAALKLLAQRPTFNCFYDIDCGKDPYGIFSMVHTEGLHALEIGVMKYMVEILMAELPKGQHRTLDRLVKRLNRYPHQHGYTGFPRCTWSDGVTSLAQLTGDQRVGKMFAILLVALTRDGEKFFTKYLPGGSNTWERMVYCFQQMLCYWAWLKQDQYWMAGDDAACAAATASIRIMARQLQTLWPREAGLQWALTKLHEQFHVPFDIHRHGNHYNVHSGPQEKNHSRIKAAAKKTQLKKNKIDLQTGERIVDRLILQRAFDRVCETVWNMDQELLEQERQDADVNGNFSDNNDNQGVVKNATKGIVQMTHSRNLLTKKSQLITGRLKWNTRGKKKVITDKILNEKEVIAFLTQTFFQKNKKATTEHGKVFDSLKLKCFTEYQRNGVVYRCHPKYRGERPYYDWCYINWDDDDHTILKLIGRIHLFIETPTGEIKAVVQSVNQTTSEAYGVFGTYWYLEHNGPETNQRPIFHLVDVDCLGDHVMIIPYTHTGTRYIHIHDRSEWSGYFQTMRLPPDPPIPVPPTN